MDNAKLSLDMLMGLSIFLFTFIFIASFLPGVFADVRNEIGLMHEAYRMGVILAEMEGYWRDQSGNGTNWHEKSDRWYASDFYFFPGLSKGKADYLSYYKIRAFDNLTKQNYDFVRNLLGLKTFDREYNFNVSLESLDSTSYSPVLVKNRTGEVVLQAGKPIPSSAYVSRYERFVWIDPYYDLIGTFYIGTARPRDIPHGCSEKFVNENKQEGNEVGIQCDLTYPIKLFRLNVLGKEHENTRVWWLGICFNNGEVDIQNCNPKGDGNQNKNGTLQVGFGSKLERDNLVFEAPLVEGKSYDLTQTINRMLKERGFRIGDKVTMGYNAKNINVTLDLSDSVALIAGKAAAKIVIHVW
ncbi:MAG: hypothetical protein HA490_07030 [Archaeoglobales archaeon]|nr:hypothetical protein [Archaeoglobales archaeon]